jgi:inhibitor of KinA
MPLSYNYSFSPLGDTAVLLDFGNQMDVALSGIVLDIFYHLKEKNLKGIDDIVPSYSSLAFYYNVAFFSERGGKEKTSFEKVVEIINEQILLAGDAQPREIRKIDIPFCFEGDFAMDLAEVSFAKNLTPKEYIEIFISKSYRVYMIGFLPGFAYMGQVDDRIAVPRKEHPRTKLPAGSVGIAGKQTGIYPVESPGGWQIIGRTPITIFDKYSPDPVVFHPGDEVNFYTIDYNEFENYKGRNF